MMQYTFEGSLMLATGPLPEALGPISAAESAAAAPTVDAVLGEHVLGALARFESEGFTARQAARLSVNPRLEAAYRGERVDTFFKEAVRLDPRLSHLQITSRFKFGPDVYDPATRVWWDVTTPGEWAGHVKKYTPSFGGGRPLFYH